MSRCNFFWESTFYVFSPITANNFNLSRLFTMIIQTEASLEVQMVKNLPAVQEIRV